MGELNDKRLRAVLDGDDEDVAPEQAKAAVSAAPTVVLARSAGKPRQKTARGPA